MVKLTDSAKDLVNGHTGFGPLPDSNPQQYVQSEATAALLSRTVSSNKDVLSKLHVSRDHPAIGSAAKPGMKLSELADLGIQDRAMAWDAFQALWTELTATVPAAGKENHFAPRPPILVTVDGLGHWMKNSEYRNPNHEIVHAHDLVFVNHFLSLLQSGSGKPALPNGGLLLYSLSTSNRPKTYTFDVALDQITARQAGMDPSAPEYPQPDPWSQADARVLSLFNHIKSTDPKEPALELQTLGGLTRDETRGYMEYAARNGVLREKLSEDAIGEKWTLASGGIIGELEKLGKRINRVL